MFERKGGRLLLLCAAIIEVLAVAAAGLAQTAGEKEEFTAFAVNTSNVGSGSAGTVIISVTRWSTEAEREKLVNTLLQKGPQAALEALRDAREVGTIRTPDSVGYPLHYAHQMPEQEGGRRIVIATDRPIGFWEAVNRPRTIDYPFTFIELHMRPDGTGEGKMSVATKVLAHDNIVELENYASQPVMLTEVRSKR